MTTAYSPGDYNVICDVCGFKLKRSQARMRWDNRLVCEKDWEPRHPQDYMVRGRRDRQRVDDARPEPDPVYIDASVRPESVDLG